MLQKKYLVKRVVYLKKIKLSAVAALTLSFSIFSLSPNFAQASEGDPSPIVTHETQGHLDITTYYYAEPINYDFEVQKVQTEGVISPMYVPIEGKEYNLATKTLYKQKSWGTEVRNDSSLNDSLTRSVSRTKFANGKIGLAAETAVNWKIIQGKVGISGEAAWGSSTTVTVSYTINLPAKSKTVVAIGTKAVETSGQITEYKSDGTVKKTPVNADYSYDEYVDKTSTSL